VSVSTFNRANNNHLHNSSRESRRRRRNSSTHHTRTTTSSSSSSSSSSYDDGFDINNRNGNNNSKHVIEDELTRFVHREYDENKTKEENFKMMMSTLSLLQSRSQSSQLMRSKRQSMELNEIDLLVCLRASSKIDTKELFVDFVTKDIVERARMLRVKNRERVKYDIICRSDNNNNNSNENDRVATQTQAQTTQTSAIENGKCEIGQICFTVEDARAMKEKGRNVILMCECLDSSLLITEEERRFAEDEEALVDCLAEVSGVIFLKDDRFGAELSKKEFGLACISGVNSDHNENDGDGDDESDGNNANNTNCVEIDKVSRKFAKFTTTTMMSSHHPKRKPKKRKNTTILHSGDYVTIDGRNCCLYRGVVELVPPVKSVRNKIFFEWLAEKSKSLNAIRIYAECDDVKSVEEYVEENNTRADDGFDLSGSVSNFIGIGLVKIENVLKKYRSGDARQAIHMLLCAETKGERLEALNALSPHLQYDFEEMFRVSFQPHLKNEEENSRVIVRLLNEPLHAFLPDTENLNDLVPLLAVDSGKSEKDVVEIIERNLLDEINPKFGLRGARVGALYPEITKEQVRSILAAAYAVKQFFIGLEPPMIDICVPNVASAEEFEHQMNLIKNVAQEFLDSEENEENTNNKKIKIKFRIGAMLETPRACLIASDLAKIGAEFLIVGLDELTETTYGVSIEDSQKFFPRYLYGGEDMNINGDEYDDNDNDDDDDDIAREEREEGENDIIWGSNPFTEWDEKGVGRLVKSAIAEAREANEEIDVVMCGQMCGRRGDESLYKTFQEMNVTAVSVDSRFTAVAKLRALQAAYIQLSARNDSRF
jgi:hypothetical protein